VRGFLSGAGPSAFFDLPWLPVYLAVCFLFHPYIGLTALGGAVILIALTVATELRTRSPTRQATQFAVARNALMESSRRNAEAMTAMGMVGRIAKRWREANRSYIAATGQASDVVGGLGAASKVLRLLLQSSLLAVGAWLVRGSALLAGQAQRIALARALYRDPFLVVLDEPNSNLDAEGDEALTRAILGLRARGAIAVVVAHRPSAIAGVDYILVMAKGRQQQFGPKEEVLTRVAQPPAAPRTLKVVPGEGGSA
jgi:ABC-type protease/lipase transport system fused ATPase/permease subunit